MPHAEMLGNELVLMKEHPFCTGFNCDQLNRLAECAEVRTFHANEYLWRQGETFDQLLLICSGEISLEISLPLQGPCRIETIGKGEVLDSCWLTPAARWPFDARALRPVTAVAMNGALLREACANDDRLGHELLKRFTAIVGQRLQNNRRRLLDGLQSTRRNSR